MASVDENQFIKDPSSSWFLPFISEENKVRDAFANGCTVRLENFNFSFDCEESYLFGLDSSINAWVSRPRAELGSSHCLMITENKLNETLEFLTSICSEEFENELSISKFDSNKPGFGWIVIRNIRINVRFDGSSPTFLNDIFSFNSGYRLKVHGGLPIGSIANTYLANGEPTLSLSDSDEKKILRIESKVFGIREIDVSDHGIEIDLWKLNLRKDPSRLGMDVGTFEISDGMSVVQIEITDAIVEEAGPGADSLASESIEGYCVKGTYSDHKSLSPDPLELSIQFGPATVVYDDNTTETVVPPIWLTKRNFLGPLSWDLIDYWPNYGSRIKATIELDRDNREPIPEIYEPLEHCAVILTAGDELLRWISEVGSGTWEQLRKTSKYLMERHALNLRDSKLGSNLSKLGHLEIDWENSRWAVVRPTLNVIPGMGLVAVLTGSRPQIVEEKFDRAADDTLDVFALPLHNQSNLNPHSRMLKCASLDDAKSIAEKLGARFVLDPASRLAGAMKSLEDLVLLNAASPHKNEFGEIKLFNNEDYKWRQISKMRNFTWVDGLYEAPGWGRPRFLIRRDDRWFQTEKSYGLFLEYKRVGRTRVFQYRSQHDMQPSYLYVDSDVVLPMLAERSLVMCSGFASKSINTKTAYINVPNNLARHIANKLGQSI
jgi:hypothetical protein